ncbi:hypothetical protein ACQ4M3_14200 [Leptolyngbya sp. AN03gr2]|uniref:hypothetical protein n=1 Tax=unclassified Leptolyngbya TaxID=2650499 RepID=UPI003D3138EC
MSSSNHNGQAATAIHNEQLPEGSIDLAKLETLISKNLSPNKKAVIERLVRLYQQNNSDR